MRTDKTPFPAFMIVNALSQMWIFALYELLRTWRQMVNEVIRYHEQIEVIRNDSEFEEKIKRLRQGKKKKIKRLPPSEEMEDLFYNALLTVFKKWTFVPSMHSAVLGWYFAESEANRFLPIPHLHGVYSFHYLGQHPLVC